MEQVGLNHLSSNQFVLFFQSIGKTESTKLMVSHIIHCSGDAGDRELQKRIIEVCIRIESIIMIEREL